jgi:Lon protease-like protein
MSKNPFTPTFEDLPRDLPLFPLIGVLLLPGAQLPLNIFEPRYINMLEYALGNQRFIGITQPKVEGQTGASTPDSAAVYEIGCAGRIISFKEASDGQIQVMLRGVCRFNIIDELPLIKSFRRAIPDFSNYKNDFISEKDAVIDRQRLLSDLRAYFEMENIEADWETIKQTPDEKLVTTLAMVCPFEPDEKQALLESTDLSNRCKLVIGLIESALRRDSNASSDTIN